MGIDNFIPSIWSAKLLETLKAAHVLGNVVNRDYEGEIAQYGDTVHIHNIGSVTVGDYTKNGTIDPPELLTDERRSLIIDQAKYFNFLVDDIDKAQQKPKVMGAAMQEAGYALADVADKRLAGHAVEATYDYTEAALSQANVYDTIAETAELLDVANVPRAGRFFVIPPFMHTAMVLAEILETSGSVDANSALRNGFVGRLLGFDFWISNNLLVTTGVTSAMAGTRKAISFAEQIVKVEPFRPEDRFADAVKGLHVYGSKVVYPDALVEVKLEKA